MARKPARAADLPTPSGSWRGLGLPVVIAALLFLTQLGQIDLWTPDEPRYAQVAEEMRSFENGAKGLVLLHLNGEPYSQKPPFYYWMAAALGAPFGRVGHWPARLPSALSGIAVIGLLALFGRRLYRDPKAGVIASLLLLGVFRFTHQARRAQLDVVLTLCELVALMAFWSLDQKRERGVSRALQLALHGAVGIGLLTKGPVAALPYLVIVVFLIWEGRLSDLRRLFPVWWPLAAGAPVALWFYASLGLAPPGYLEEAATRNLWTRFFSGLHHPRPIYYFLYQLPLDFLPWTPVVGVALASLLRRNREPVSGGPDPGTRRFLLAWLFSMLIFFSISAEKRGLYMLPAFPALALMGSGWLTARFNNRRLPLWLSGGAIAFFILLGTVGILMATLPDLEFALLEGIELPRLFLAGVTGVSFLSAGGLLWWHVYRPRAAGQIAVLLLTPIALECLMLFSLFPALDQEKSYRPVAEFVARSLSDSSTVGIYRRKSISGAIEYYSGHRSRPIEDPAELSAFRKNGGRLVVAPLREKPFLQEEARATVLRQFRQGKRSLVVVELIDTPKESSD